MRAALGLLVSVGLCGAGRAQVITEVEPNSTKAEATVVSFGPTNTLTGTSTGGITTPGDTTLASADVFRVQTTALPPGIYRHTLSLTVNGGPRGHATSLRGRDQSGTVGSGGTPGNADVALQSAGGFPSCSWYGFGNQEEVYYRVSGAPSTTAPYRVSLFTSQVAPTPIAPLLESQNPITIETTGLTGDDTEILLYDASFQAVPGGLNDDEYQGTSSQSRLTRVLAPGTYYLAIGFGGLASDQTAASDDDVVTGLLADFPGCVVPPNVPLAHDWDFRIVASNGTHLQPNPNGPFVDDTIVTWFEFTTQPGAPVFPPPPANDACANALAFVPAGHTSGTLVGATHDGNSSCDGGGTASRDVWYAFTNPLAETSVFRIDSCPTQGGDVLIALFGACGGAEIACVDDCPSGPCGAPQSCLQTLLAPAQSIRIRVSDKGLGGAAFLLAGSNRPLVQINDSCATPLPFPVGGLPAELDTLGASTGVEGQAWTACGFAGGTSIVQDVWFTWTSSHTGPMEITTCGTLTGGPSEDSKIAVYVGAGCPTTAPIACSDSTSGGSCASVNASAQFNAVCSQTYTFQVGTSPLAAGPLFGRVYLALLPGGTLCGSTTDVFCRGDALYGGCPCGNPGSPGNGCAGSVYASGAQLVGTGRPQTTGTLDTWVLTAHNVPGPCLFFQSTAQTLVGSALGDGKLCTSGTILRLGVVVPSAGVAQLPNATLPTPLHVLGGVTVGTRSYQCWYRSFPGLCGNGPFDLTQGVGVFWFP